MNFHTFAKAIERQFAALAAYPLFRVNLDKDTMWQTYLASFPEGSNPIYRERTTHDCSCCRHFIRDVGNVVAIVDDKLVSIWDIDASKVDAEYAKVARSMAKLVKAASIVEPFLIDTPKVGAEVTRATEDGSVVTYNHFFATVPITFVKKRDMIPSTLGDMRTTHDVYLRALNEITVDAVDQVIELINSDSIYRGAEFLPAVKLFAALQKKAAKAKDKELFAWQTRLDNGSRIRNTAIGTLLVDLSEGVSLEAAVASFEAKVAPTNYKRPKSLVTQRMIDDAKAKVEELGLLPPSGGDGEDE